MRELCAERNVMEIRDELAGAVHEFYYRMPTTKERMQFQAGLWERKGKKIVSKALAQQLKYGLLILTGIKTGTLSAAGKPLSTTPGEEGYREDWKKLLENGCPELVALLARTVFEGAALSTGNSELQFAVADEHGDIVAEDAEPLGE